MLFDMEENQIFLTDIPNGHVLVLGKSGMGKTYYTLKTVAEAVQKGKSVLLFDYSGSYRIEEIKKVELGNMNNIEILNPMEKEIIWTTNKHTLPLTFAGAILKSLHNRSYYQKKLLVEGLQRIQKNSTSIGFDTIILSLEDMLLEDRDSDIKKNILHLLARLEPYSEIKKLRFIGEDTAPDTGSQIKIIQLSDFPVIQRQFLTIFLTELFWEEVRKRWRKMDIVVFDEFQCISLKAGTSLAEMLREGRKFGLSMYLSSQFIGKYSKDELNTLFQCGNILFFRPTVQDAKKTANMISPAKCKWWELILKNLGIGEAVLLGNYQLNGRQRVIEDPIVCKVR